MEQQFRLAEIEVSKATLDEKIVGVFRYESESSKSRRGSTLLILAEIASTLYVYEQLLDVVNAAAEQARHLTIGFDTDPMARFEKLIQRLNDAIAQFAEEEPNPISWNRVNLFAVELSDGHLCLSGLGRIANIFFQKQADGSYRQFDLFGSLEQPAEVNPKKIFGSLICGDIAVGDILFAGTLNFERLRGELQLAERLTKLPPVTAALEVRQDLERRQIPDDFAGVVVACVALPDQPIKKDGAVAFDVDPIAKSTESVEKMQEAEADAQAMLSTSLAPLSPKPKAEKRKWWEKKIKPAITNAFDQLHAWHTSRARPAVRDPLALASLRGLNAGHGSFMTPKRKLTIAAGGAIILAAIIGTLWYRAAQKAAAEQTLWNASLQQAQDDKNRADADLVFGNESDANHLVAEADAILANLDEKTNGRKAAKAALTNDLNGVKIKLQHIVNVDHPTQIATGTSPKAITFGNGFVFAADGSDLLAVHADTHEVKRIALTNGADIVASAADGKNVLLFAANRSLLSADPISGKVTPIKITMTRASSTQSAVLYNKKIYLLDPVKNMIWKYVPAAGGFGADAAYIKQTGEPLADATAIAIDSNIYVAFKDGRVIRYLSGAEETWAPNQINPPLTSASSIWTTLNTDRLVIADPANKRVIVFRKDGTLLAQITSPDFQTPSEVTGDDKGKKIYVVDGSRILSVDLP